jgi:hypothetical protein
MNKFITVILLCFLICPLMVRAQQEMKQSPSKEIMKEAWVHFQDHSNISFLGQLDDCNGKEILKLKVINHNQEMFEVRVSYLNGSKRLGTSMLTLQPMQEIELSCAGAPGAQPVFLADGKTIRVESIVIKRK